MPTMSMNKVIHGAIRRDLQRFLDALGSFRDGDRDRAAQLGRAWDNFDAQLTDHHEGEHEIAWPAMAAMGLSTGLLATFDEEHEQMAHSLADARSAMATFRSTATAADAAGACSAVQRLHDVAVAHLDHEEAETEAFYLTHAEDPEMKAMGKKFSKVSPAKGGRFFAWVSDGATTEELATLTGTVPRPVLALISGVWGRSYRRDVAPAWRA